MNSVHSKDAVEVVHSRLRYEVEVSYTLNGHHSFKFLCKAEITPVTAGCATSCADGATLKAPLSAVSESESESHSFRKQRNININGPRYWSATEVYLTRARFMTGVGYRLLASANFGELVLGCIRIRIRIRSRLVFEKKENLGVCAKQNVSKSFFESK